jgi:tripartite ATP-independent transporter DctM subunit
MSALFITYIIVRCWWSPHLAPPALKEADMLHGWARWKPLLVSVAPLMSIFFVMIGSIFMGWASPTDSAALGCLATVVLAGCYRVLTVSAVIGALKNSAIVTTMIFFIVAASTTFAQILAISGATDGALGQLLKFNLTPLGAVLCMVGVLIFLGCFMEQIAMMLLTLPFFIPLANSLHIDMLWLSIVLLISLQIGLIHPPFGLLLFVMRGVAPPEITVRQIWMSIIPFVIMVFAVLFLIIFVPWIATGVARLM